MNALGFRSNELSSLNTLHERKLYGRSRTREQSFVSVYYDSSVSIDNIMMYTYLNIYTEVFILSS
jgi:hypothetical protein